MTLIKSDFFKAFEKVFVLSPFFLVFWVIFNFPDTKYIVSRLLILVSLYCAVRFYKTWKKEIAIKMPLLLPGVILCSYFFIMQFFNDGNSDLPRSIFYILLYLLFLPVSFVTYNVGFWTSSIGGGAAGISALYELHFLNVDRVGFLATNPIPFSFYSGLCIILASIFILLMFKECSKVSRVKLAVLFLSICLALIAVVMSQTRATFLALFIVSFLILLINFLKRPTKSNIALTIVFYATLSTVAISVPEVKNRLIDAFEQISDYSENNYDSSTGIRVKLWQSGVVISSESYIFGHSKDEISEIAESKINEEKFPKFLEPFLVHPNPNFHNQFIQNLVDSGLIGLTILTLFISAPIFLFSRVKESGYLLLGSSITIYTAIALWFDSLFLYNQTVIIYGFVIMMIMSCTHRLKE